MAALRYILAAIIGAALAALVISQHPELASKISEWVASISHQTPATENGRQQSDAAVQVSYADDGGFDHLLGPHVSIRVHESEIDKIGRGEIVKLRVGRDGLVLSARCQECRKEFERQAEQLARTVRFITFQRGGSPVVAEFEFQIPILPNEVRPHYKVEFPRIQDWNSLKIRLSRAGCYGPCPQYWIEVGGDGNVKYSGGGYVALTGTHQATLSPSVIGKLVEEFQRAQFFWLNETYSAKMTDAAAYEVSISFDGRMQRVHDYVGLQAGMPDAVANLEDAIDRLVNTDRWTKGNSETAASLVAEGWDFKSKSEVNTEMIIGLAQYGSYRAVREVMALGVPITTYRERAERWRSGEAHTALDAAALRGDDGIAMLLLEPEVKWQQTALSRAMFHAAMRGRARIMDAIANAGDADQSFTDQYGKTVLMMAAGSGVPDAVSLLLEDFGRGRRSTKVNARDHEGKSALFFVGRPDMIQSIDDAEVNRPKVIELLAKAGADLNLRDKDRNTALIGNYYPDAASAMLKAGVDVNAQNSAGKTALMNTYDVDIALILLKGGADPLLKNVMGETAVDVAKRNGRNDIAALIESWMKQHPPASQK